MSEGNTHHIAVIGPKDMIAGFRALGAEIFPAESGSEALTVIKQISNQPDANTQYAVILIISSVLEDIPQADYVKTVRGALPAGPMPWPLPRGRQRRRIAHFAPEFE